jgi:hypothetical protein
LPTATKAFTLRLAPWVNVKVDVMLHKERVKMALIPFNEMGQNKPVLNQPNGVISFLPT